MHVSHRVLFSFFPFRNAAGSTILHCLLVALLNITGWINSFERTYITFHCVWFISMLKFQFYQTMFVFRISFCIYMFCFFSVDINFHCVKFTSVLNFEFHLMFFSPQNPLFTSESLSYVFSVCVYFFSQCEDKIPPREF